MYQYWQRVSSAISLCHTKLTHWGRMTHICVSKLSIIGSDNNLLTGQREAIIWNNDRKLSISPLGIYFSEILIGIQTLSFRKMHLKMLSTKWHPFYLGLSLLKYGDCKIMVWHVLSGSPISLVVLLYSSSNYNLSHWWQVMHRDAKCIWQFETIMIYLYTNISFKQQKLWIVIGDHMKDREESYHIRSCIFIFCWYLKTQSTVDIWWHKPANQSSK